MTAVDAVDAVDADVAGGARRSSSTAGDILRASVAVEDRAPVPLSSRALAPGDVVAGRYRVVRALGRGSFGRTFLAVDTASGARQVALKHLYAEGEHGWKAYELFEREAAALRSLRHHGIPEIFEHLREAEGGAVVVYLVMEYIEGSSLEQRIEEGGVLDPAALLRMTLGLLDILEYLHSRVPPVLHRDIKPANVILRPDGAPALVDFGAVRTVFRRADEGGSTVVGTSGYMPFEQYMGQASPASDLYALGATLLHVITGRAPSDFVSADGAVEVPAELPGGAVLRGVIARLLAPSASARYPSAAAVREVLLAPALSAAGSPTPVALARVQAPALALAPGPRAIEGELMVRFDRVAMSPMRMIYSSQRPSQPLSAMQRTLGVLLGLVTLGIVPLVYWLWYEGRRAKTRRFFEQGVPASARILQTQKDATTDWYVVTYEFTLDGATHRGVDTVFPAVGGLWHAGDAIEVMVMPEKEYESIIITSA